MKNRCEDRPGRPRGWRAGPAALSLLAALTLISACGGDPDERAGDQPVTGATTFGSGRFDELPRFDRSEPLGPRTEKDGTVAQSFKAEGATPAQVLDFYVDRLKDAGWEVVEPVQELGAGTVRGRWAEPDWMLTVSAASAPTLTAPAGGTGASSQYSLSLEPAEVRSG